MSRAPEQTCRISFAVLVVVGLSLVTIGITIFLVLPYVQLDAILTPQERVDLEKREYTLGMLKRANGNLGVVVTSFGLMVTVTSLIGHRAARELEKRKEAVDQVRAGNR
jgi:hypothetical protein